MSSEDAEMRTLGKLEKSYLRGKQYHAIKLPHGGGGANQYTVGYEKSTAKKTSAKLAESLGVSDGTIKRDARLAILIDGLAEKGFPIHSLMLLASNGLLSELSALLAELEP